MAKAVLNLNTTEAKCLLALSENYISGSVSNVSTTFAKEIASKLKAAIGKELIYGNK